MARIRFRAHGPTEPRSVPSSRLRRTAAPSALAPLTLVLAACVSYEPAPVELALVLAELEARRYETDAPGGAQPWQSWRAPCWSGTPTIGMAAAGSLFRTKSESRAGRRRTHCRR